MYNVKILKKGNGEMDEKELVEDLRHFDELEFFVKKYNSSINLFEKLQDVLSDKELRRMNECATWLKYALFKTENGVEKKIGGGEFLQVKMVRCVQLETQNQVF